MKNNLFKLLTEFGPLAIFALYYYSNGRPEEEINKNLRYHNTIYKNRKNFNETMDERMPIFKKLFGKIYIRKKIKPNSF